MALQIAKQPAEFEFGSDFELFFKRFSAYVGALKIEKAQVYDLFTAFLDDQSLRKVTQLQFTDDHKTDNVIDIVKAKPLLKEALTKPYDIPPQVQIRYCLQKHNESITDYANRIQTLGTKAFAEDSETSKTVIEAFCSGLVDGQLAAKMWRKIATFDTLKKAIAYGTEREAVSNLTSFIDRQHQAASSSQDRKQTRAEVLAVSDSVATQQDAPNELLAVSASAPPPNAPPYRSHEQGPQRFMDHNVQRQDQGTRSNQAYHQNDRRSSNNNRGGNGRFRAVGEQRSCYYCQMKGHVQADCYRRQNDQGQNQGQYQGQNQGRGAGRGNRSGFRSRGRNSYNRRGRDNDRLNPNAQDFRPHRSNQY